MGIFKSKKEKAEQAAKKAEDEYQKAKTAQEIKVKEVQAESDRIDAEMKQYNAKVKKYSLDKNSMIRLMECMKMSVTKGVRSEMLADGMHQYETPPEPIETLIDRYEVRELVEELSKLSDKTFTAPYTAEQVKEKTSKLEKERKKLNNL